MTVHWQSALHSTHKPDGQTRQNTPVCKHWGINIVLDSMIEDLAQQFHNWHTMYENIWQIDVHTVSAVYLRVLLERNINK